MRSRLFILLFTVTSVLWQPRAVTLEQRTGSWITGNRLDTIHTHNRRNHPTVQLTQSHTQKVSVIAHNGTVYFTMTLPQRADRRFETLSFVFTQPGQPSQMLPLPLDPSSIRVFMGTVERQGPAIALAGTWVDETGVLWVGFNPPLPSGSLLTVAIKPRSALSETSYQYGIAAYLETTSVPILVGNGILRTFQ